MTETTLGDLARGGVLSLGDGYRTKRSELAPSGFRIIRVADVQNGHITSSDPEFVSTEYASKIGAKRAINGDILLTTKGTVGRVAVVGADIDDSVYSPQLCWFRIHDLSTVCPGYFRYWLQSSAFMAQASYLQSNTDMAPYISLSDLRGSMISLPEVGTQQAIAEVLGALDDKIAANTTLADTAEGLADAYFADAVREASYGSTTFADLAAVSGGGTPSTKNPDYWDGSIPWATPTDITSLSGPYLESTKRTITTEGLQNCSSALYPAGSILMTSRATIGAFAVSQQPTAVNQGFIVVQPHGAPLYWIFHEMRSRVDEFISMANGATFLELSRGNFKKFPVRLADPHIMSSFSAKAEDLHASARTALVENNKLSGLRDTLLPQLMSGKLRVKDAEKVVEGAV